MRLFRFLFALLVLLFSGCFATWDTVKTRPYYAREAAYLHFPAPAHSITPLRLP